LYFRMVKNLIIYTLFLILLDCVFNLFINLIQDNPGSVIITSAVLRIICLAICYPIITILVYLIFRGNWRDSIFIIASISLYVLMPVIVYFLKRNNLSLIEVYLDLHLKFHLFAIIFLPYILASITCFILYKKFKNSNGQSMRMGKGLI
jgi:hypothetical protein